MIIVAMIIHDPEHESDHILGAGCDGPIEREAEGGGGGEIDGDGAGLGDAQESIHLLQWVEGGGPGRGDGDDHGVCDGDGGHVVGYGEDRDQLCLGVKHVFSQVVLVKNSTVIVLKNSTDFNSLADLI